MPLLLGALSLWIGNAAFDPAPASGATGLLGGLLGFWLARRSPVGVSSCGLALGLLVGVLQHGRVHLTGGSVEPEEGLLLHFAVDFLRGSVIALPPLACAWWGWKRSLAPAAPRG